MIQGGDGAPSSPTGSKIDDEFNAALQFTSPGLLAMANAGQRHEHLAVLHHHGTVPLAAISRYTIFGMVTQGMDIVNQLDSVPNRLRATSPPTTVTITDASIITDTQHSERRVAAFRPEWIDRHGHGDRHGHRHRHQRDDHSRHSP